MFSRKRAFLKTVFIFFIVVFFISIYQYITSKEKMTEDRMTEASDAGAALVADQISGYIERCVSRLNALSRVDVASAAINGDEKAVEELNRLINLDAGESDVYLENMLVLNADKDIILSTAESYGDIVDNLDDYLERAATGAVVTDSQLSFQPNTAERYFAMIVPVFENRRLIGYIMSRIDTEILYDKTEKAATADGLGIMIYDGEGNAVLTRGTEEITKLFEGYKPSDGEPDSDRYIIGKREISMAPLRQSWHVYFIIPRGDAVMTFFYIKMAFLLLCSIILLAELLRSLIRYKRTVLPIRSIIFDLKKINKSGDYTMPVSSTGYEDFDIIGSSLNDIVKGIIEGDYALEALTEKYKELFNNKKLVFIEWDFSTFNMSASPNYKDVFNIDFTPFGEIDYSPDVLNIHPDDAGRFIDWLRDVRMGRKTSPIIYRKKFADGKYKYLEFSFYIRTDDMGNPVSGLGCIMDVDRFMRKEIALKRAAEMDRYTRAYNKYTFLEILEKKLNEAKEQGEVYFVCMLKLHNFYALEDESIGLGEEALRFITSVLTDNLDCVVGRILSDALGIVGNSENIDFLIEEVRKELDMGFVYPADKKTYRVYTNMAVMLTKDKNPDLDELVALCVKEYENFKETSGNNYYIIGN